MDFRGKKYERGSNWSDPEVVELLQLWADESVQMELESCLRNQHVFNRIAEVLREKGIHRTGDQCREKVKKMKLEYRRIKDNNKICRGGRTWKFFEVMDRVLSNRPNICYSTVGNTVITQQILPGVLGAGDGYHPHHHHHHHLTAHGISHSHHPQELMDIKCEEVDSDGRSATPEPPPSLVLHPGGGEDHGVDGSLLERGHHNTSPVIGVDIPAENTISPSGYNEPSIGTSSGMRGSGPAFSSLHRLRRKRKPPRVKDPLDDILLKFLTAQRVVEERFLQMEERRMQRDMELEDRRMQLEQRRMELEREHEYRMFTIFAQMVNALRHGGSTQSMGLDLSQAFTPSSGQAPEMGHVPSSSSTTASKENSSRVMQQQSKSLPNGLRDVVFDAEPNSTFQNFNSSIYLSKRGNEINNFCGGLQEGFVAYHADKHDEDTNPNGIVNLGTSENKLCFDLLCKRLTQKDMCYIDPQLLQYSDWKGHQFLREEVGRFLTYHCKAPAPLKPENIVVVNGCGSLYASLATVVCDPKDRIILPTPFYGVITGDIFLYSSIKPLHLHLDSKVTDDQTRPFQLTVEKLEKAMQIAQRQGLSIKAMILMNPHNPLGDSYSGAEMTEFLEFAKRYKLHVIVDEVYMLSVFGDACSFQSVLSLQRLPDPQRTHVMWGISKDLAASGLRVSTLYTANMDIISALGQLSYFHALPGPTQHAVAQLLKDRDWINQVFLPTNRARLKTAHKYIADELTAMGIPFLNRSAGLFIWADFRKYLKSPTFEEEIKLWRQLLENKVLISNGKEFFCCEPGWFRIVFSDKTYRIQLGMQRLKKVLEAQETEAPPIAKEPPCPPNAESKAESAEDLLDVAGQPEPPNPALDGLIGLLRQQMRTSDWLQRNTAEQFAQENPEDRVKPMKPI
ncbi:1-aminocyclopropane-1-carboxylate synthase-like protein 1 isoform X2 [Callorhinchus milii]|uniref:1-aminocyclopropane-1-carboxylate synthase-like protein 1 n=1 Tax=Callorhinchus milii TaxID=7868 RepID=A0A4W3JHH9_CALMI|nr:1-aminocyclopropane-1-carboxylate synthase-like protein 1 isoform X2 [Callorhinchus milii]